MDRIIKSVPIPIAGLMLGLAAAGNLVAQYGSVYKNIFGFLSAVIFVLVVAKIMVVPKSVLESFENPAVAGVMPTFSMGVMILATYIKDYLYEAAYLLWFSGLCLHLVMMYFFTKKYILNLKIEKVFPSYFVVYVGIVCGSVSAPAFGFIGLGQFLFWFGFVCYLILLPLVLYRVLIINIKGVPEPAFPTIAILSAPASLCLAGYLSSFQDKSLNLIVFLSLLSLSMFFLAIMYIPGIMRLKFYPSYSALTFPFVITAVAVKGAFSFLTKTLKLYPQFLYFVRLLELWAIAMVIYVFIRYVIFILSETRTPDVSP